jgi:hypothetical protein
VEEMAYHIINNDYACNLSIVGGNKKYNNISKILLRIEEKRRE